MDDCILVLSFSDRTALDLTRRIRGERVFSLILPGSTTAAQIRELSPKGIILSGEEVGSGVLDAGVLGLGIPVLAVGHTAHMMLTALGGACAGTGVFQRRAEVHYEESALFRGIADDERYIHELQTMMLPGNLRMTASIGGCTAAYEDAERKLFAIQFELERNDPTATDILKNFLRGICGCEPWFTTEAAISRVRAELKAKADTGLHAVCAVSGGLDSAVLSVLSKEAFGDRMTAVYVETGLMRASEVDTVQDMFDQLDIPLLTIDRHTQMLEELAGARKMQEKQKKLQAFLLNTLLEDAGTENVCYLFGTDYSDRLFDRQPVPEAGSSVDLQEPLSAFFRSEISEMALLLGIPDSIRDRKPFPPLGLGALAMGEVREDKLRILRGVDVIFRQELKAGGLLPKLYDFYPQLSEKGAFGGGRQVLLTAHALSGGKLVPARLPYDVVERTVNRILMDYPTVSRVMLDETPTLRGNL